MLGIDMLETGLHTDLWLANNDIATTVRLRRDDRTCGSHERSTQVCSVR
jgi:hypothetical protein